MRRPARRKLAFERVSGGEKKRLSIAIEILTRPQLLFLDEPTSGLDSAASFFVVQILRNLAMDGGRTIIASIHQPSSEAFSLFDDLFLLSAGETVYFGGAKTAIEFFAEAGYPCPSRRSPSDHFLRCINSDFDKVTTVLMGKHDMQTSSDPLINVETAQIKATLVEKYRWSEYAARVRAKIQEIASIEALPTETKRVSQATWWKQLSTLSRRSFKNMCRDVGYYWARLGVYIIVAVCVGTIFYHVGTTYAAISARGAYGSFIAGFMVFMSIGGFPSFVEELKVFNRERDRGYYGSGVYVLSNMLSSMPLLVLLTMVSSSICYYMVEFRPELSHFVYSCLMLFACISAVESSMMVVASLVSNYLLGLLIGAGVIVIMMMNSRSSRLLPDLHKPFRHYPISYISLGCWALQGWYKNDLLGLEFDTIYPGKPKLKGADIIRDLYGIRLDHSKWWDLAAVYMIFISYRIIFFLVLEFKQRTSLVFRKLNTKKAWHSLKKRPLLQMLAFPSKRYQPQQSLYSQGLSSPIS
ncbi:hypothetical protein Nepgr_013310 [Nepenthes gracilis]|uniref:Uncharacterized protein n=1 Tax=Nepenthes gracilis TaxID=150966 RepID=A0AAD3SIM4_NEPGR|nr:hypothetical protein Nepgr_013310 [Nepenthes gracilis]